MLKDLILHNRSYRGYDERYKVDRNLLLELVELARLTSSAGNVQPLKYFLSYEDADNQRIYPLLRWSRCTGEKTEGAGLPTAYICMFVDMGLVSVPSAAYVDAGIAAQTILLGAVERGLGGCIVTAIDRLRLKRELMIAIGAYEPFMVIALGKPYEDIILEESGYDTVCYADERGARHVPKRQITDIIIGM